ncbi:hypothetical protein PAXRUDRAFT_164651 [Paxillus rubicundulus Ve08.2h10]|uniref:Uncharacterized protein n=1 Tax=Paxillus rubicundulus Ve08.2h10 TaxID=930991 RepID=A0A0D0DJ88_9AGAM|nr:hypothetical protein PAXRUDRAFT_164651 [Paxillus rubicundulus Ve08.2h10]
MPTKTQLSSHGTIKGYPVIARLANLPVHICNGERFGGGCVVGWLPIVPEPAKEQKKTGYTNFKHVIWHDTFYHLLEKVAELSKVRFLHKCFNQIPRWLFPLILILSADYKELYVLFSLPLEKLWDLSKTFPMRTTQQHKDALAVYEDKKSAGEKKLKSLGLRPVHNVFWSVKRSDPQETASFESLHFLHGGMWGKHMLGDLKIVLAELGREFEMCLEEQVHAFPRWCGLAHFDTMIHITYSDGNKMWDLAKQCFYAGLNILTATSTRAGYQLLHMICSYLQLNSLIGLDVHTENMLAMIESKLLVFRDELKAYQSCMHHLADTDLKLNWNFPKAHLWKHVTCDIRSKGVTRNYSAQPNEKMHGPLKDAYQDRSNGKDVAGQILCIDHHHLAIKHLQGRIDAENERASQAKLPEGGDDGKDNDQGFDSNAKLGAPQPPTSLSDIEADHTGDRAFGGFRRKLEDYINRSLPTYGYQLECWIPFHSTYKVRKYQYLKVKYVSEVDWRLDIDHLRCNPLFHGRPRYDCALIQFSESKVAFVRLIFMFTCVVNGFDNSFKFALVQPLTSGTGVCRLDRDFKLIHVKSVPRASSIFIPVKLIIQGMLLYPDPEHHNEFLVVECIDGDMFLQMKEWRRSAAPAADQHHLNEAEFEPGPGSEPGSEMPYGMWLIILCYYYLTEPHHTSIAIRQLRL